MTQDHKVKLDLLKTHLKETETEISKMEDELDILEATVFDKECQVDELKEEVQLIHDEILELEEGFEPL